MRQKYDMKCTHVCNTVRMISTPQWRRRRNYSKQTLHDLMTNCRQQSLHNQNHLHSQKSTKPTQCCVGKIPMQNLEIPHTLNPDKLAQLNKIEATLQLKIHQSQPKIYTLF